MQLARGLCYKRRKSIGALGNYDIPGNVDFNLWSGPASLTDPKLTRPRFHYDWHWQRHYGNGDPVTKALIKRTSHAGDWESIVIPTRSSATAVDWDIRQKRMTVTMSMRETPQTPKFPSMTMEMFFVFETRGLDISTSSGKEVEAMFGTGGGNKIGVIFYGSDGYVAQVRYDQCKAFDKDFNVTKEFKPAMLETTFCQLH